LARDAYARVSPKSLYYVFALAKGVELSTTGPGEVDFAARLNEYLSQPLPRLQFHPVRSASVRPVGFRVEENLPSANAPLRILVHWTRDDDRNGVTKLRVIADDINHLRLRQDRRMLELRWVENMVPFGAVEYAQAELDTLPGWPDAYRIPEGHSLRPASEGNVRLLTFTSPAAAQSTMASSVFVPVASERFYLLGARCRSGGAPLVAGWNWIDANDRRVDVHNVYNQERVDGWQWAGDLRERQPDAAFVQASIGIYRAAGSASFAFVFIVPMTLPSWF
jgi:hypothetical protein